MKVKSESEVAQSCPTLRDPVDCSLPGSSIRGIFQPRVLEWGAIAFSCSVTKSCQTLCDHIDCSTKVFLVLHYLSELAQTHVQWVGAIVQLTHSLLPASPPALNLSQHQGLFQWVGSSHQVAKVLELQFQHQSFQWIFRVDLLEDGLVWSFSPRDS